MPVILRRSTSTLGMYLAPQIKSFIVANQSQFINNPKDISADMGADALANAIAYGIAKALSSPQFVTALNAGVFGVTAGVVPAPIGSLINTVLTPTVIEA